MLYANSIVKTSEKSLFRKKYDLATRKAKRLRVMNQDKMNAYCCLVIEYPLGINLYRDYELYHTI